jgi:hypothetical protein
MAFIHSTPSIFNGLANGTPILLLLIMDMNIVLMIWQDPQVQKVLFSNHLFQNLVTSKTL